jgi:hypothetical protein
MVGIQVRLLLALSTRRRSNLQEPPAARRAVGNTRLRAAELASLLRRVADTLEQSAALADAHAERYEQAGRSDDAALKCQAAGRARDAARHARSRADECLELAGGQRP